MKSFIRNTWGIRQSLVLKKSGVFFDIGAHSVDVAYCQRILKEDPDQEQALECLEESLKRNEYSDSSGTRISKLRTK
ncbi:hypothetical protein HOH87_00985 [bacterium]|nr:hypothetical protein [bacterium]